MSVIEATIDSTSQDTDLYGDLSPIRFNETSVDTIVENERLRKELEETRKEIDVLLESSSAELRECREEVATLKENNAVLKKENKILKKNISSLFMTAKHEIQEKDEMIKKLKKGKK